MSNFCGRYCRVIKIKKHNDLYYLKYKSNEISNAIRCFNNARIRKNVVKLQYYEGKEEPPGVEITATYGKIYREKEASIPPINIISAPSVTSVTKIKTENNKKWMKISNYTFSNCTVFILYICLYSK